MRRTLLLPVGLVAVTAVLGGCSSSSSKSSVGSVTVEDAWVRAAPAVAQTTPKGATTTTGSDHNHDHGTATTMAGMGGMSMGGMSMGATATTTPGSPATTMAGMGGMGGGMNMSGNGGGGMDMKSMMKDMHDCMRKEMQAMATSSSTTTTMAGMGGMGGMMQMMDVMDKCMKEMDSKGGGMSMGNGSSMGGMDMGSMNSNDMSAMGMNGSTGAAYVTIVNKAAARDTLVAVTADVADSAQVHQTVIQKGVMQMREVRRLAIPAKGKVELKTGSFHIMLMGLKHDLKAGGKVKLTLTFEKAGTITVTAPIREA